MGKWNKGNKACQLLVIHGGFRGYFNVLSICLHCIESRTVIKVLSTCSWSQLNKTFTHVIYKCSHCFRV